MPDLRTMERLAGDQRLGWTGWEYVAWHVNAESEAYLERAERELAAIHAITEEVPMAEITPEEWDAEDPLVRFVALLLNHEVLPSLMGGALREALRDPRVEGHGKPWETQYAVVPLARDIVRKLEGARAKKRFVRE